MEVKAWVEQIVLPTYKAGAPEKNPMFLEKRVYQGSSGVVYPHPVIEKISDEKTDEVYTAVFLENDFLRIMILPQLGGRVQRAYDKIRNRDFVYYNQVVKPALVGLAGPWISGGIEFNWPQHHRPSTFSPVDYTIEENADGSKTVWVNELEIMFRTKGMAGFTLYPDKAYLEIKGRLFNRSPFPQTFLWWANPAVKVNEHYQSIFPPDVYAVFDHGKRDVSDFPIATGTYYKVNYAPGTDISRYDTIPVPTSYMAIRSKYDFMGCYENDTQAGMLHVADHHLSPGKKQWTWGNGDFGYAWDRNLTDEDGPYIELMTGVFTDNQPDFSWILPNEGKTFEQYFMPYATVGHVKNATREAMVNLEWNGNQATVKVYATGIYETAAITLSLNNKPVQTYTTDLSPLEAFEVVYTAGEPVNELEWKVAVTDKEGGELVSYQAEARKTTDIPAPASAALPPSEIGQVEELFLTGLHLEQYRHATFNPIDYYEEGLKRSPGDVRCNNAMGLLLLRRGQFEKAEPYFHKAIETLTARNPNPPDGEPFHHLGWCLFLQHKPEEAYAAFFKATWNDAWQHNSFLMLARIAALQHKTTLALELVDKALVRNYHSHTARHLKAVLLRKLNKQEEARASIAAALSIDPFNFGCRFEAFLWSEDVQELATLLRGRQQNFLELALEYGYAGCYEEALRVLDCLEASAEHTPMLYYYKGWIYARMERTQEADQAFRKAGQQNPGTFFPNRVEEILILREALRFQPEDAIAYYQLGNLWYDKRQYDEAIACWEAAVKYMPQFATPWRNLALAYYNKRDAPESALQCLEKAFELDPADARVFMELDQLYKLSGNTPEQRIRRFNAYPELVEARDDLYLEQISLLNTLGKYQAAVDLLGKRIFHPWEGGEGKVVGQYLYAHIELAKEALLEQDYERAIGYLEKTFSYPHNLGEGKLYGTQENDVFYLMGCAMEGQGKAAEAKRWFQKATVGIAEPAQAVYYNDPQPDKIVYQALAWRKLDRPEKALEIFQRFISFGKAHLHDKVKIDYFAVSLPDMLVFNIDLDKRNRIHCSYLIGLGLLGTGEEQQGKAQLEEVLNHDRHHQGARAYLKMLPFFTNTVAAIRFAQ